MTLGIPIKVTTHSFWRKPSSRLTGNDSSCGAGGGKGKPGFQPGNACAKGGGSSSSGVKIGSRAYMTKGQKEKMDLLNPGGTSGSSVKIPATGNKTKDADLVAKAQKEFSDKTIELVHSPSVKDLKAGKTGRVLSTHKPLGIPTKQEVVEKKLPEKKAVPKVAPKKEEVVEKKSDSKKGLSEDDYELTPENMKKIIAKTPDNGVDVDQTRKEYDALRKESQILRKSMSPGPTTKDFELGQDNEDILDALRLKEEEKRAIERVQDKAVVLKEKQYATDPVAFEKARMLEKELKNQEEELNYGFVLEQASKGNLKIDALSANSPGGSRKFYVHASSFSIGKGSWHQEVLPESERASLEAHNKKREDLLKRKEIAAEEAKAAYFGEPKDLQWSSKESSVDGIISSKPMRGGAPKEVKEFFDTAEVAIQTKEGRIDKIASQKRMKNAFEGPAGVGKGKSGYKESRRIIENDSFGLNNDTDKKVRPIYGYVEHPDRLHSEGASLGMNYGTTQIVLKSTAKQRATFTLGDSLDDKQSTAAKAGTIGDPPDANKLSTRPINYKHSSKGSGGFRTVAYDGADQGIGYVEAQIHGGITLSDIKEIRVLPGAKFSDKSLKNLAAAGVRLKTRKPALSYGNHLSSFDEIRDREDDEE